jgi:hypothetical protein
LLKNKNPKTINRHQTSSLISSNKKLLSLNEEFSGKSSFSLASDISLFIALINSSEMKIKN